MKFIEPKVEEIVQKPGYEGMIEQIDYCAGICYGRLQEHESFAECDKFVHNLISKGHMRPLEFGTVYLIIEDGDTYSVNMFNSNFCNVKTFANNITKHYVTTNFRYITENRLNFVLSKQCEPTEKHVKRRTFKITCSRAVADEFRTHVTLSSLMQSTRYCKTGELEIIKPYWYDKTPSDIKWAYESAIRHSESIYHFLLDNCYKAQEARGVLPMDMKTTLLLCGNVDTINEGWDRFLKMRCDSAAHPDAQIIANQVKELLKNE